jgi:hypothetical protein
MAIFPSSEITGSASEIRNNFVLIELDYQSDRSAILLEPVCVLPASKKHDRPVIASAALLRDRSVPLIAPDFIPIAVDRRYIWGSKLLEDLGLGRLTNLKTHLDIAVS